VARGSELDLFAAFTEGYRAGWALFPDVLPMVERLPDLPRAVVTNGDGAQQREKVAVLGLAAAVDAVLVSSEVGAAKPDPRIMLRAAQELGVPAGRCLMVGDQIDRDVRAALAAGMQAAWLRRPDGPQARTEVPAELAGRFTTIESLSELPGLLGAGGGCPSGAGAPAQGLGAGGDRRRPAAGAG